MNTAYYLTLQSTYTMTAVALCEQGKIREARWLENKYSSKLLISEIDSLLKKNNLSIERLSFIAAYQGPAPFTSLRTVIATVNGLVFGLPKPLAGINGLELLAREYAGTERFTLALLNAFCDDVYYALLDTQGKSIESGCLHRDQLMLLVQRKLNNNPFLAIGNGVLLHQEKLTSAFGTQIIIPEPVPEFVSLEAVVREAYSLWQQNNIQSQLMPLYLKQYSAIIKEKDAHPIT